MKRKLLNILSYIAVAAIASFSTFWFFGGGSKLDELQYLIEECYIGDVDSVQLEDAAAQAMIDATGDIWSYYIPAAEYGAYIEQMENAYVGIGVTIQLDDTEEGYRILEVTPGGPAEEAGVQAGDLLIAAAGTDVRGLDMEEVRALVKGPEGTSVALRFLRKGETVSLNVERRQVLTPVATYELLEDNIGLITIANFDSRCASETIAAIESLIFSGANKLIFDVRFNPGGYAEELVELLDYLLPEGELFRTEDYTGKTHVDTSDANWLDLPMVVLINGDSYSAAEFFAAALSEYEAATLVGEPTLGKGYFQTTFQLSDGSAVSLSIGKYFTPKGVSLAEAGGLTPDYALLLTDEQYADLYYGALPIEDDPQIQKAIEILKKES